MPAEPLLLNLNQIIVSHSSLKITVDKNFDLISTHHEIPTVIVTLTVISKFSHCHFKIKTSVCQSPLVILLVDVMPGKRKADDKAAPKAKSRVKPVEADAPKDDFSINAVHYAEVLEAWNQIMKFLGLNSSYYYNNNLGLKLLIHSS